MVEYWQRTCSHKCGSFYGLALILHRHPALNRLHARQIANGGILVLRQGVRKSHRGMSYFLKEAQCCAM